MTNSQNKQEIIRESKCNVEIYPITARTESPSALITWRM